MANSGYIKTARAIIDHAIFDDDACFKLFSYCIIRANHKPKDVQIAGKVVKVQRGQFVTSWEHLARDLRWTVKKCRVTMSKLERVNVATRKGATRFSLITVLNYDKWQGEGQERGQEKGQRKGSERATNKNVKNVKKKTPLPPSGGMVGVGSLCLVAANEREEVGTRTVAAYLALSGIEFETWREAFAAIQREKAAKTEEIAELSGRYHGDSVQIAAVLWGKQHGDKPITAANTQAYTLLLRNSPRKMTYSKASS